MADEETPNAPSDGLEERHHAVLPRATRLAEELRKALSSRLDHVGIPLAFPVQARVKSWASLTDKLQRLQLNIREITQIQDLVGLRIVVLFRRDLQAVAELIAQTCTVERQYDTSERLKNDQFGYSSLHFIVRAPDGSDVFADLRDLQVEVQLRTMAQHMWAASSQFLQYKHEDTVPPSVRRALSRGSAVLEIIDLEFDRILAERDAYRTTAGLEPEQPLNVDLLEKVLDSVLPAANKAASESYDYLLQELRHVDITTVGELQALVHKWVANAREQDARAVLEMAARLERGEALETEASKERVRRGVFYSHTGLMRGVLTSEFGSEPFTQIWLERVQPPA